MLGTLNYAWSNHQVLHRDIKPANVMITDEGQLKILNMGLAKSVLEDARLTVSGTIVGTPNYISPEQASSGSKVDFRSDLYSVGATLYYLLSGRPPFGGDSVAAIITGHVMKPLPSIRKHNSAVTDACAAFLRVLLAKKRGDRYASYEEAIDELGRILQGVALQRQPPASASGRRRLTSSRRPRGQRRRKSVSFKRKRSLEAASPASSRQRRPMPMSVRVLTLLAVLLSLFAIAGAVYVAVVSRQLTGTVPRIEPQPTIDSSLAKRVPSSFLTTFPYSNANRSK